MAEVRETVRSAGRTTFSLNDAEVHVVGPYFDSGEGYTLLTLNKRNDKTIAFTEVYGSFGEAKEQALSQIDYIDSTK